MALEMSFEDNGNNRRVLKRNFWMFRSELMKILCLFIEFNLLFWKLSKFCDLFLCASKTIRFHFHFSFAGKSALVTDLSGMQSGFEMNSDEWIFTQWPHRWRPSGLIEVTNTHLNPSVFEKNISKSLRILCQDLNRLMEMKGESSWLKESPKLIFISRKIEIRNSHESKDFILLERFETT